LLSILLCFGFTLSSEVHAQGGGPKFIKLNDVLPATTQLRLTFDFAYLDTDKDSWFTTTGNYIYGWASFYDDEEDISLKVNSNDVTYTSYIDGVYIYDLDTSTLTEAQRTVDYADDDDIYWTWEDLAPTPTGYSVTFEENGGTTQTDLTEQTVLPNPLPIPTKENHTFVGWYYDSYLFNEAFAGDPLTDDVTLYARWLPGKLFEKDDVLPATTELKIRILFGQGDYHVETVDRSGIYLSIDWIGGVKDLYVEIGGVVIHDAPTSADEVYYTIDISNWSLDQRTIKSVSSENGSFVTWEDTTPDDYTQGYLTAREEYGYYDPITNQWLSVEEYLDLYGTDKPGQSDFYNNFDKYFIPAMIIVFGGAIVLTILKVFKGRE